MAPSLPKVCAVILNLTDTPGLLECLRSLCSVTYENLEVIVVHNGPHRAELEKEVLEAVSRPSKIIFTGCNIGFASGNNLGIRDALKIGADYVLLLNDDTVVAADFLSLLVARAAESSGVGMVGPRIFYFSEPEKIWFSGAEFDQKMCAFLAPGADQTSASYGRPEPVRTAYVTGCALLISKKCLESVGLLDERFFLYWEDADWGLRAGAAGFNSFIVPAARIWHKVSASSGGDDSPLKAYYKTKGLLLFSDLHAPLAKKSILAGLARDIAWLLLKSRGRARFKKAWAYAAAIFDHYSGRGGSARATLK